MTFEANHDATTIVVTLYGDVTPERETHERKIAEHRAKQLAPPTPKQVRERAYIAEWQ